MEVIFQSVPAVRLASNTIIGCPTVLQFNETPLLEITREIQAGFTIRFPVYDSSGIKIANVVGPRIILTEAGKSANITQRHEPNLLVCERDGKPILELRKTGAAALQGAAELYSPSGYLVKASDAGTAALTRGGDQALCVGGTIMHECRVMNAPIGLLLVAFGNKMGVFWGANWPLPEAIVKQITGQT